MSEPVTPYHPDDPARRSVPPLDEPALPHAAAGQDAMLDGDDDWVEEYEEQLPHRPRRRLVTPFNLSLLGVLLVAGGFIAGVLVEKGQTSSTTSATSGVAALARRAGLTGAGTTGAGAAARSFFGGAGGAGANATTGTVSLNDHGTLYITDSEGNTIKVVQASGGTVTRTAVSSVSTYPPRRHRHRVRPEGQRWHRHRHLDPGDRGQRGDRRAQRAARRRRRRLIQYRRLELERRRQHVIGYALPVRVGLIPPTPARSSIRMKIPRRSSALATSLVLGLACVALAACGSSSSTTTTSANASASTSGSAAGGAGAGRFAALRTCLQKQGITLPQRPAGAPRTPGAGGGFFGGGGGGGGGGGFLSGANATKIRAALQKCGGGQFGLRRRNLASSPTAVAALTKFAACMRSNGINVPPPNTSGTGPVFNTSGLDTTSTAFKTAYAKCTPDLPAGFGRRPGGAGATGAAGAAGSATGNA